MEKQQQALQEVGVCTHPTLREPERYLHTIPVLLTTDCWADLAHQSIEESREGRSAAIFWLHRAYEWRGLLRGSDTLYRSKAGRERGNRVNAQHSNKVPKSQTLTCE